MKFLKKFKKLFHRKEDRNKRVAMVVGPLVIAVGLLLLMQPAGFNVGSIQDSDVKMEKSEVQEKSDTEVKSIVDKSKETYLKYEKPVFARVHEDGQIDFLDEPVYTRGEPVHFALMKVGPFTKDEEGKNWVDMDMLVTDPDGDVAMMKNNLLGSGGHLILEDDTAPSPSGVYVPGKDVKIGEYTIELRIYDKIGGGEVSDSGTFTLR